ncbi:hypothetical protein TRFO_07984 [Tritrichomonas foetus]|uniref:Uncharacterized protein n=1 Tax=Tritrichomonas foetus TaxID=1144522 RepID=A0A1J4JPJ7_9EUKA|nr:hypothetical protein TRFO_07984 [Tritrichomonas foetus]|eukprot:OHT00320.1 hypothetical protein TRFO_07984 [Tritrichomonas foetus]
MEHVQNPNIKNGKNQFPYQCTTNAAIRDLFYRTYVVPKTITSFDTEKTGISNFRSNTEVMSNKYQKELLTKLQETKEQCENYKKLLLKKNMICKTENCENIAFYACSNCGLICFCEECSKNKPKCVNPRCNSGYFFLLRPRV